MSGELDKHTANGWSWFVSTIVPWGGKECDVLLCFHAEGHERWETRDTLTPVEIDRLLVKYERDRIKEENERAKDIKESYEAGENAAINRQAYRELEQLRKLPPPLPPTTPNMPPDELAKVARLQEQRIDSLSQQITASKRENEYLSKELLATTAERDKLAARLAEGDTRKLMEIPEVFRAVQVAKGALRIIGDLTDATEALRYAIGKIEPPNPEDN